MAGLALPSPEPEARERLTELADFLESPEAATQSEQALQAGGRSMPSRRTAGRHGEGGCGADSQLLRRLRGTTPPSASAPEGREPGDDAGVPPLLHAEAARPSALLRLFRRSRSSARGDAQEGVRASRSVQSATRLGELPRPVPPCRRRRRGARHPRPQRRPLRLGPGVGPPRGSRRRLSLLQAARRLRLPFPYPGRRRHRWRPAGGRRHPGPHLRALDHRVGGDPHRAGRGRVRGTDRLPFTPPPRRSVLHAGLRDPLPRRPGALRCHRGSLRAPTPDPTSNRRPAPPSGFCKPPPSTTPTR